MQASNLALVALTLIALTTLTIAEIPYWIQCYPNSEYTIPDNRYCDKYYLCKDGNIIPNLCEDGLGFVPFGGCKPLYQVECGPRVLLQPPSGNGKCPRLNGFFSAPEGCGRFYKCYDGIAQTDNCPKGQMFDDVKVQCRYPSTAELLYCTPIWYPEQQPNQAMVTTPSAEVGQGMGAVVPAAGSEGAGVIPDPNTLRCPTDGDYPFGDHSRHPIPGQCKFFFLCIYDGTKKISGCPEGLGFNPKTKLCDDLTTIPDCSEGHNS